MTNDDIKFKTIQLINGTKHLSTGQFNDFKYFVCYTLSIEKTEENFEIIKEAVELYFQIQNNIGIINNQ